MKHIYISVFFLFVIQLSFGQIGFEEHTIINASFNDNDNPTSAYSADLDGDGDNDIVAAFSGLDEIVWYENVDGRAFYIKKIISNNLDGAISVHAADLDGDGDVDVVSTSDIDHKIVWHENNGQGEFGDDQIISTSAYTAINVYTADLDNDGDMDVLGVSLNRISWFENLDGLGTFAFNQIITNDADGLQSAHAVDIDNDGDMDILSASEDDDKIAWYENLDGQGDFGSENIISVDANSADSVYASDIDGDGDMDVLSASKIDDKVAWYENIDGQGNFSDELIITEDANGATSVFASDVDNDGDMDVLSTSILDSVAWYENVDGLGSFGAEQVVSGISNANDLFVIDMDNDGDVDIITTSSSFDMIVCSLNSDGSGLFNNSINIEGRADNLDSIHVADFDNDGDMDLISDSNSTVLYENINGQGEFSSQQVVSYGGTDSVLSGDIDNDGDQDVLTSYSTGDDIFWVENLNGQGVFGDKQLIANDANFVKSSYLADIDNDGDEDVLAANFSNNNLVWYENTDGLGTFGAEQVISSSVNGGYIHADDLDNDGDMDVIASLADSSELVWYENVDGNGSFGAAQVIANSYTTFVHVTDFDSDGDNDIICSFRSPTAPTGDDKIVWFENLDSQGSFSSENIIISNEEGVRSVYAIDLDNDGFKDIVAAYFSSSIIADKLVWYKNLGSPSLFSDEQILSIDSGNQPTLIKVADVNNDGFLDIVSASDFNDKIVWHENLGLVTNEIKGTLSLDIDNDGCDTSDLVGDVMVLVDNGTESYTTFSFSNGFYQLYPGEGDFVTSLPNLPNYYVSSPVSQTSNFVGVGNTDTVDFCIEPIGTINDLNITVYPSINNPRPGFNTVYRLVYKNVGTTQLSGAVGFEFDNVKLQFLNASETVSSQTSNVLTFDFIDLNPFETRTIDLEFNVYAPPVTEIGDELVSTATINPISGDETENDNVFTLEETVVGSYDPNDITCLEGDQIVLEDADKYLHYLIRFQNTGTASAINVRVENVLDDKLDWTTMQLESLSHDGRVEILNGSDVSFIFDNINLPDSTNDEPNSHGFIAYKIKPMDDVVLGDIFYNTANIYFDFNPPITTNTAATEIVDVLSLNEIEDNLFSVYPNPTTSELTINGSIEMEELSIIDINGRLLKQFSNIDQAQTVTINISELNSGLYFLNIQTDNKEQTVKFVKK